MIKVLILEDDKITLNHYKEIVENALCDCEVYTASTGKRAMSIVTKNQIDLMLLDMELDDEKKVLGLDYANMISCEQPQVEFIVISGYSNYLRDAGDVEPYYYFMKPVNEMFLTRKLMEWQILKAKMPEGNAKSIKLQTEVGMAIVPINRICYIEKMNRKVKIMTSTKEYVCRDSLRNMLTQLDNQFYHSHQSFVVNLKQIESVEAKEDRTWGIHFKEVEDEALLSRYKAKEFFGLLDSEATS
ncbi:MAG: response regulator transcription factor [Clostridiales bacterium]|nr:response regulator transcription factor [Clostridiales bacterium]